MPQLKQKYGTQITAEARDGKAIIRIVDTISDYGSASSEAVRYQVDGFLSDGVKTAEVYINSRGGNVFESAEIANEFNRFDAVKIRVGALAASAATYFLTLFPSSARPNSQFMIHRPRMGTNGDIVSIMADLKLLENTTADYKASYARKMGKTEVEIEALWSVGDVWLTAKEALEMGLISEIEANADQSVTAQDIAILEACGAPVIPEKTNSKINKPKVERNLLIVALGLDADATDEQIESAVKTNKQKADEATASVLATQQNKAAQVEAFLTQAITVDKKIKADQKEHYAKLATADFDTTAAVVAAMPALTSISAQLTPGASKEEAAERKSWTLDDYIEKDPTALQRMMDEEPEKAARLETSYFNAR